MKHLKKNIKNKDEIIKYAYETQRGNSLLLITFFAQKKIEEKGFMEELEKNYGIYLDVDNFIIEMNKKLEEIKTYKDLYAYIGSDFGKDKTDMKLIIEAYDKAKEKGYIKPSNNQRIDNTRNFRGGRGFNRGRGNRGFGGRGRGFGGRGNREFRGRIFRGRGRGDGFRGRGRRGYRGRGGFRDRGFNRGRDRPRDRERSRSRSPQ